MLKKVTIDLEDDLWLYLLKVAKDLDMKPFDVLSQSLDCALEYRREKMKFNFDRMLYFDDFYSKSVRVT